MTRAARVFHREALGLPAFLRPGRAVVALCEWQDYNYEGMRSMDPRPRAQTMWVSCGLPPTACRASLGDERLTVWLPQGARILIRAVSWYRSRNLDPMTGEYAHVYGTHERMTRTRIRITLTELPNLGDN